MSPGFLLCRPGAWGSGRQLFKAGTSRQIAAWLEAEGEALLSHLPKLPQPLATKSSFRAVRPAEAAREPTIIEQ